MSAGWGLGCKLTSVVHVRLQGDPQRTQGPRVKGPRSQGLPGPQGWDCHGPQPDHRHVQPGEGTLGWEGKCWPPGLADCRAVEGGRPLLGSRDPGRGAMPGA